MTDVSALHAKPFSDEFKANPGVSGDSPSAIDKTRGQTWGKNSDDFQELKKTLRDTKPSYGEFSEILEHNPFKVSKTPSADDIKEAKTKIDKLINPLVGDADRAMMTKLQDAVLDGDPKAIGEAVKGFAGNPEKLKTFVDEMERNLQKTDAGVHVSAKDGALTIYKDNASSAVEIGADGNATVRAISIKPDGTVVAEPGEVLNKTASEILKDVAATAINGINEDFKGRIRILQSPELSEPHPWKWHEPIFPKHFDPSRVID